jgi:hypothetical protein
MDGRDAEVPMERGLLAPLSPNEQTALRRVANGITKPKHLRPASVARLKMLALVEEQDGRIRLTPLGATRCQTDSRPLATSGD